MSSGLLHSGELLKLSSNKGNKDHRLRFHEFGVQFTPVELLELPCN